MAGEAFFLPAAGGECFCLLHRPERGGGHRAVVYVQPFAEEMNKARRMAAVQARALAAAGCLVLQIDFSGCGDSAGEFGDAAWQTWVDELCGACAWLRARTRAPLWLWGLRTGCLLAAAAAPRLAEPADFLFWQPVQSGRQYLQQFLRLKAAAEMQGGEAGGVMERLREELARGETVEIAGYALSPALAAGLEQAELTPPAVPSRLEWFELSSRGAGGLSPASLRRLEQWQAAGHRVRGTALAGPPFWQTTEIEESPALLAASLAAVCGGSRP